MTTQSKVHEQSRWELVAAFLTGFLIMVTAIALFVWAIATPTTDPRNDGPRPAVTKYAHQPYSA